MSLSLCRKLIIQATFKLRLRKEKRERPRYVKPKHRKFFNLFKQEEINEPEQRRNS